jgi:hypothetical protein
MVGGRGRRLSRHAVGTHIVRDIVDPPHDVVIDLLRRLIERRLHIVTGPRRCLSQQQHSSVRT